MQHSFYLFEHSFYMFNDQHIQSVKAADLARVLGERSFTLQEFGAQLSRVGGA